MSTKITERRVFMCREHQFVIECATYGDGRGGKASVRKSPGDRKADCGECNRAVRDMYEYIKPGAAASVGGEA